MSRFLVVLFAFCVCTFGVNAQKRDSLNKNYFELSFGHSQLFISNNDIISIHNSSNLVLPTSSVLMFSELRTNRNVRIPIFFNLPTESNAFLVNGQLVYQRASPSIGTGFEFKLLEMKVDNRSKIEAEAGPLATLILDWHNLQLAPIAAGRIKIIRGGNFLMYAGGSYTFGLSTFGFFYGTGFIF